jgi:protease I
MNNKIAIIIAFKDFRDEEYFNTNDILEKNGFKTKTFSNEKGIAIGRFGGEAMVNDLIENINIDEFNAIIFIGGSGAKQFLDNEASYDVIKKSFNKNIIIGAICIAPIILAKAGILKNKKATVWSSNMDKSAIKIIEENGGLYEEKKVVSDKNIITGQNHEASELFALKIIEALTNLT